MQKALWKGNISFGLVNIAVELLAVEKNYDLHFKLLDKRDHQKIRYQRVNEKTHQEVPWDKIVKGYDADGRYIELTDSQIKELSAKNFKSIDIENFVDINEISPIYYIKPYYLIPDKKSVKAYVLLREVLKRSHKAGIAKLIIHNRQHLASLMACGNAILIELLRYDQQLHKRTEYDFPNEDLEQHRIYPNEIAMAEQLIDSMSTNWDPASYHDETHETLLNWIKIQTQKTSAKTQATSRKKEAGANIVNIEELLKKSLPKNKKPIYRKAGETKKRAQKSH